MSLKCWFLEADEKTISVIYRFAYFPFAVSFMCTIIKKLSRRLNSDGTPPPPLKLEHLVRHCHSYGGINLLKNL